MNLDDTQRKKVAQWISEGLKLSEIQSRLASELSIKMTYMDVRLLVDDLKLTPKDRDPVKTATPNSTLNSTPTAATETPADRAQPPGAKPGGVAVQVDQVTRPGAMVSGKVTFSDGKQADWYMDQTGRLGLVPQQTGYRPPAVDLQKFQAALDAELSKIGF